MGTSGVASGAAAPSETNQPKGKKLHVLWENVRTLDGRPSGEGMGRPDASHDLLTYDDLKGSAKSRLGSNREIQALTGNLESPKHR